MSIRDKTISGVKWTTAAKVGEHVIQFGLTTALMRLLGPESFGLIAMVVVFSGFAMIFNEMGLTSALVQRKELREEHCSTMFWANLVVSSALTLLFFVSAPLVASFYGEPLLKPMTQAMSICFVLGALGKVPRALLQRSFRFDALARASMIAMLVSGAGAIVVALLGGGVWSLLAQQVGATGVSSALLAMQSKWRPRFLWSPPAFRDLWRYGIGLTGFSVVNYWARAADKLLIGRMIGSEALGLYSRAYSLMLLPMTQVINVLAPVMFPALAAMQHDRDRVRKVFLRVINLLSFITFPMMLGLVAVAEPFVVSLFGEQWGEIVPLVQLLSFVGLMQTINNPTGWIYKSQGRTDWMFWWGMFGSGVLVISIIVGILLGGVREVAISYLVGNVLITPPCIIIPGKLIGMRLRDVWRAVWGNLLCATVMAASVFLIDLQFLSERTPVERLAVLVTTGALLYLALAFALRIAAVKEVVALLPRLHTRKPRVA